MNMLVENIALVNECSAELPFILQSTCLDGKHSYGSWKNVLYNENDNGKGLRNLLLYSFLLQSTCERKINDYAYWKHCLMNVVWTGYSFLTIGFFQKNINENA